MQPAPLPSKSHSWKFSVQQVFIFSTGLLNQAYVVDKEKGVVNVGWIIYVGHNAIEEEGWEEDTEKYMKTEDDSVRREL